MYTLIDALRRTTTTFKGRTDALEAASELSEAVLCDQDGVLVATVQRGVRQDCDDHGLPLPGQSSMLDTRFAFGFSV